jgi:hypothetical protein
MTKKKKFYDLDHRLRNTGDNQDVAFTDDKRKY